MMDGHPHTLIACIGNIFLGDDGFGSEVASVLRAHALPVGVKLMDYGIRGFDLAYALLEPYEAVIFVDVVKRGGATGRIYVLQPADDARNEPATPDPHTMDPIHLMSMARSLGEISADIYIVGCEPGDFGDEFDGRMGLSEAVSKAVPQAVQTVMDVVARIRKRDMQPAASFCATF
jgi:hydrogenase maturation protease